MRLFILCLCAFSLFAAEPQILDDLGVHGLRKLQMTVAKELIDPQLLVYMKSLKIASVVVPPKPAQKPYPPHATEAQIKKVESDYHTAWEHREACKDLNSTLSGDEERYHPSHGYSAEFIAKDKDAMLLTLARNTAFMRNLEEARGGKLPPFVYKP